MNPKIDLNDKETRRALAQLIISCYKANRRQQIQKAVRTSDTAAHKSSPVDRFGDPDPNLILGSE